LAEFFWLVLVVGGGYLLYRAIRRNRSIAEHQSVPQPPLAKCPNCQAAVEPSYLRCPECGYRLKKNCPSCGKIVKTGWRICPYCEADLKEENAAKPAAAV